ncbi:MAG: ParB/RepB/Spo0J family partition protein [Hyphomonadaceae bacterium]|nr:ParB/RepB/Spo0J family partition protein [Hyphomonadaceae bacterium]
MSKAAKKADRSKLGRGLSALMAEITPPEESKPAPKQATKPAKKAAAKKTTPKKTTKKAVAKKKTAPKTLSSPAKPGRGVNMIPIDKIERNPDQPRKVFDQTRLNELSQSIKDKGVLQPILLRPLPDRLVAKKKLKTGSKKDFFQIVAGERRWQAALKAGLDNMPALIRELTDQEVLEVGVVENVQRADLNPIEEAMAYQALKDQFGRRQEDIANAVGKSRSHVANSLRMLTLPALAREYLSQGKITPGHARAILAAPDQKALAEAIVDKQMSVREAEVWARRATKLKREQEGGIDKKKARRDADSRFIEKQLSDHLGLRVDLKHKNPGGTLSVKYKTLEQLDDLIKRMRKM